MEPYNIIRILVVIIAGFAIYFGYKLFYLVAERQGKLKISGKDNSLELEDVGPGIFFAAFGTIILVSILLLQPYNETINTNSADGSSQVTNRTPAGNVSNTIHHGSFLINHFLPGTNGLLRKKGSTYSKEWSKKRKMIKNRD